MLYSRKLYVLRLSSGAREHRACNIEDDSYMMMPICAVIVL
jgi:hypothetical protein